MNSHMVTIIIRILVTLTFLEIPFGIWYGTRKLSGILQGIRDDANAANIKADAAIDEADLAVKTAEELLKVGSQLRDSTRIEK